MPSELLINGGYVVTMDPALGDQPDSDVLVPRWGNRRNPTWDFETSAPDVEVIEARGRLVIPGLVDTRRHVWPGAIGGFTPQMTGAGYDPGRAARHRTTSYPRRHLRRHPLGGAAAARRRDHDYRRLGPQPAVG